MIIMKISESKQVQKTSSAKKASKAAAPDGDFGALLGAEGLTDSHSAEAAQAINAIDTLLAAQSYGQKDSGKRAMVLRAEQILDALTDIRIAIMDERVTVKNMVDLADVISVHKQKIQDPRLSMVLEEVDVRAQVELAKMARALKSQL